MTSDDLIKKWLNNELELDEKRLFNQLDDAKFNKLIIESAHHFKASQFSELEDFDSFKKGYNCSQKTSKRILKLHPFLKIAAIFIITLGIYYAFFNNNLAHIETLASEKATIELPDHSIVELNVLSKIEYSTKNWAQNRTLTLDGEAYFEVAKGKTFDVITNQGTVSVVGTKFNVKQRDHYFEVKCFEGIVKVTSNTITRFLKVGDTYQILNGTFTETRISNLSPHWTKDRSVFKAIPFKEVVAELERQYHVKVDCVVANNRLFSGGFTHNNLNDALTSITQPMNLTYTFKAPKQVTIHERNQ